jgi:GNAT superfamily N-acetyltransferase
VADPGPVRIRLAREADIPALVDAHARSWRASYGDLLPAGLIEDVLAARDARAERWRTRLADPSDPGAFLVAEIAGQAVGLAITGPSRDEDGDAATGEVYAIYLDPGVIGRGVGRALFAAAVADLVSRGFERAILWVLSDNMRARRFYEAAGWRPDGATKRDVRDGGTLDGTRYRRELPRRGGGKLPPPPG